MASSLIPEKPLVVSPQLAATIGLEEAVLLSVLHDIASCREQAGWCDATPALLQHLLPFWSIADCQRIARSLSEQGIVQLQAVHNGLRFSLGDTGPAPAATPAANSGPRIPSQWQPSVDVCRQLALQGIPQDFIDRQTPEFVLYWSSRDGGAVHSWDARFYRHVIRAWREEAVRFPVKAEATPERMSRHWQPEPDAIAILMQSGIPGDFIEEALPEFVLYWQERGDARNTWNSAFVRHVRLQWLRVTESLAHEREPRRIPDHWQPADEVYEILAMANIDPTFARGLVDEFVMYWKENGKPHAAWNSKFLRHVKHCWAHRDQQQDKTYAERFLDTYTDTSWAEHL